VAKNILIIDDEELIVKSLKKLLEKEGYGVLIAKSGQDALIITEEEKFDLIIADIRMPGLNGVDTIKSIRENAAGNNAKETPVIFITGYADEEMEKTAKTLKPLAYIYKPFNISDLVSVVNKELK